MSPTQRARRKHPPRRARGSLNEEEIISAAIALIERDGLDGLSMPNLANYLDAGVMSVYVYFRSKDDLLAALAQKAFLSLYAELPPVSGGSWDEEIMSLAIALHQELRQDPLYIQLCRARPKSLVVHPDVIPVLAHRFEAELQVLDRAGMTVSESARLLAILGAYTRGFALMQLGDEEEQNGETAEHAMGAWAAQLNPAQFPNLRAATNAGTVASVDEASFENALRLLIAGKKAKVRARSQSPELPTSKNTSTRSRSRKRPQGR